MTKAEMELFFDTIMKRCGYSFDEAGPMLLDYMRQDGQLRAAIMRDGQKRVVWQLMEEWAERHNNAIRSYLREKFEKEDAEAAERRLMIN